MVVTTDFDFPEPEENKEKTPTDIIQEVNAFLEKNVPGDVKTIQDIAKVFDVGIEELTLWIANDDELKRQLERFPKLGNNTALFDKDKVDNRLDLGVLATLISEAKEIHKPE